jgi:type I restriction enzyme S subunit
MKRWQSKQLGDLCEVFADGDWVESKDQSSEGIRLIQTGNVGEGIFKDRAEKARYISEATFKRLRCTEIVEGDCLISRLPDPVGRSCILPDTGERMITAVDCTIVRFNPKQLLPEFFNFYSQSLHYLKTVDSATTGTTRNRISRNNLGLIPVPVPPLHEQKRIVAILDEAFEGIGTAVANAEKNLANARELFDSYLNSVFTQKGEGWVEKSVGEMADHSLGKMLDKQKNRGSLKPYLRNLNVRWFEFDLSDMLEMRFEDDEHDRYTAIKGDVLICEGGYPGRAAIWQGDKPIYFQKAIHRVRFREDQHNKWFLYFLYMADANNELRKHFTGTGIQHFTGQSLHEFRVPVPPMPIVRKHVERFDYLFDQIKSLEAIYRQKLADLAELKQAILQKAFAGELTAQPEKALQEAAE